MDSADKKPRNKERIHEVAKSPPRPEANLPETYQALLRHLEGLTQKAEESKRQAEKDMNEAVSFAESMLTPLLHKPHRDGTSASPEEIRIYFAVLDLLAPVVMDMEDNEGEGASDLPNWRGMIGQHPQPGYTALMSLAVRIATSTTEHGHITSVSRALGQKRRQRFADWVKKKEPEFFLKESHKGRSKAA